MLPDRCKLGSEPRGVAVRRGGETSSLEPFLFLLLFPPTSVVDRSTLRDAARGGLM